MAKQVAKTKVRKKRWFPVVAPRLFREQVIGEIHLYEPEAMLNRRLRVNMMNLTGNPRNQQINVMLKIKQVQDGKGHTEVLGYEMMPSAIKRIVRRGRTKVADSIVVSTSDNKKVKIKPLLITNTNANKSIANSLRILMRNTTITFVSKITFDRLIEEIMTFKLQKHVGNTASRIAPIKNSEIMGFKLMEREGIRIVKVAKMKKPVRIKEEETPVEAPKRREEKPESPQEEDKKQEPKEEKKEEEKQEAPEKEAEKTAPKKEVKEENPKEEKEEAKK